MDTSLIKSKLTCTEYLRSQGYTPSRSGRMVSPLRPGASNPTSFHVGDNFFYDFGSGTGGDVIDLAAQLEYGGDIGKAIRGLSQRLGLEINHPRTSAWHDAIQDLCNRTEFYHSKLTEDDRKSNRRLSQGTLIPSVFQERLCLLLCHPCHARR